MLSGEFFFSRRMMRTTMAQMESMAMQMVVSLAGFGPHTDWREEEMCVGGRVVTLHTLSGSDLANCMSGSVLLVEGVRDGVNTCSWWLGLGMITAGPEFRLSDITI